jgi:neutral ceramidase
MLRPLTLLAVCFVLVAGRSHAAEGTWKAGVAKENITPEKPMWMSGYGARDHASEGKLTDLWVKALAIEDASGHRAVLVTLDLVGIGREISTVVADRIEKEYKLPRADLIFNCSHTHTGPVVGNNLRAMYFYDDAQQKLVDEYTEVLKDKTVAVVGAALQQLAPAKLSWNVGRATFAVNRRANKEAEVPALREQNKLLGPVDHDVPVLSVQNEKGELISVVCGYACHSTVLSFYQWSGDWPGFAQIELEKRHPGAIALFWAGCGADQNPLPRRTVEFAQQYGKTLADGVDAALKQPQLEISPELKTVYQEIPLPFAEVPTKADIEANMKSTDKYAAGRARVLMQSLDADGKLSPSYPYPVQTWRLGQDGPALVALGGEVVVDYALRLKFELGAGKTWVLGYSNDVMAYIPSRRVLLEGGYEGASAMVYYGLPSAWGSEVENLIVAEVHRQSEFVGVGKQNDQPAPTPYKDHSNLMVYADEQGTLQPVKTPADWAKRRADILVGMEMVMGPLPSREKLPPLDVQEVSREEGDGFTRIHLTYVADAGDRVPAHLYIPHAIKEGERRPAMLALHPTSELGKRIVADEGPRPHRGYARELAQRGYVVLAPDYLSFGDYADYNFDTDSYVSGTMKAIFNHMRGVDLLQSRADVDPEKIGSIGHSLGGHNTMYVGVFDTRLKVLVSSCGWDPFHDYYGGKIAGWASDRYMPRIREIYGLDPDRMPFDFYEVVAALAPRAFFSCSPTRDGNFRVAGVQKAIPKAAEIYKLLGAEQNLVVRHPDSEHDFPDETRFESYEFIDKILEFKPTGEIKPKQ